MTLLLQYLNNGNHEKYQGTQPQNVLKYCWILARSVVMAALYATTFSNLAWSAGVESPLVLTASSPLELTAELGDTIDDVTVTITDIILRSENAARVQWRIEPTDAARLETPSTTYFTEASAYTLASTSVTVLKEGTFHIIAGGLYDLEDEDLSLDSAARAAPALAGNEVAFTVNEASTDSSNTQSGPPQPAPLSNNQLQARDALQSACASIQSSADQGTTSSQQTNLLTSCDSVQQLDDPAVALHRIAAEELFSLGDTIVDTAQSQTSNLYARINNIRAGQKERFDVSSLSINLWGEAIGTQVFSTNKDEPGPVEIVQDVFYHDKSAHDSGGAASNDVINDTMIGFFANGSLSVGSVNGDGLQRDADISSQRLTLGTDYRINNNVVVGTGIGLVVNDTDFRGDNGALSTTGMNLSVFGTWYEPDQGYADLILDLGRNSFDLRRRINLPGQTDEFATGSTSADLATLAISAARTFNKGSWTFGPTMRLNITGASVESFQEQSTLGDNGSGTTLNIQEHSVKSLRMALGADVSRVINTSMAVLVPVFRVEYEMESENDKGDIKATFIHDPGATPMRFTGTKRDSSYLNFTIGTTAVFAKNTSAFVFFETRAQNDFVSQTWLKTGLRMHF